MGAIIEDVRESAEWIAGALISSGYLADFSPESLFEIDRFFEENSKDGNPLHDGLLAQDIGTRIFAIGGYIGEVIRRSIGGDWDADDSDHLAEINIHINLVDGSVIFPVQRAMKRLKNGAEDGIAVYGRALGLSFK
jgi:hypothetical protein